jgi:hypothetical protein
MPPPGAQESREIAGELREMAGGCDRADHPGAIGAITPGAASARGLREARRQRARVRPGTRLRLAHARLRLGRHPQADELRQKMTTIFRRDEYKGYGARVKEWLK